MPEGGSQKEAHYRPDHGENSVHFVLSPYYPSLLGVMGGVNPSFQTSFGAGNIGDCRKKIPPAVTGGQGDMKRLELTI